MTRRIALRPLARILEARQKGENPDAIERENLRLRHEQQRDSLRQRAESRLFVLAVCIFAAFGAVGVKMTALATSEPEEPTTATSGSSIISTRADIVDRQGRVLATNLLTNALYVHPHELIDPEAAAEGLAGIFDDLDAEPCWRVSPPAGASCGSAARSRPNSNSLCMTWASRGFCSARARCGFTPTGRLPRMCWAARGSGNRRSMPPRSSASPAWRPRSTRICATRCAAARRWTCRST